MADKTSLLQVRLDSTMKERFQTICKKNFINPSELVRGLILNWMETQEAKEK